MTRILLMLFLTFSFSVLAETQSEKRFSFMGIELNAEKKGTLVSLLKIKPSKFDVLQDEESFSFLMNNVGTTVRLDTKKGKIDKFTIMKKVEVTGANTGKLFTKQALSLSEEFGLPLVVYSGMQVWKNQSSEIMVLEFSQLGNAIFEIKRVCSLYSCHELIQSKAITHPEYLSCKQDDDKFIPCSEKEAKNLILSEKMSMERLQE